MNLTRRELIALSTAATATGLLSTQSASAADGDTFAEEKIMNLAGADKGMRDRFSGNLESDVTVIEYASPTCPHCTAFHANVMPAFSEAYIDTDKIRFVLRPFVRNALDAVVFLLAETATSDEGYNTIVDTYFDTANDWGRSDKPRDAMLAVAQQLGFTEETFTAALTNQALFEGMELVRDQALNEFDLTGTPTFYVNGKQLSGGQTLEDLAAAIDPLLS